MSWQTYIDTLPRLVRETGNKVSAADLQRALASAVTQYGQDAPRTLVRDFTWSTAGHLSSTVPAEYSEFAAILGAELLPATTPPTVLELAPYVTEAGLGLMCEQTLAAGASVRMRFTAGHVLQGGDTPQDTIPPHHADAVLHFAAHLLCRELATLFSGEIDSSVAADSANTESRARNYAARAKEYRASYFGTLNIADPMAKAAAPGGAAGSAGSAAGAVTSWPARPRPSWRTNGGL